MLFLSKLTLQITAVNDSETQLWTGSIKNVTFRDIAILSEGSAVVFANGTPIADLVFERVNIEIAQWYSNYSVAVHDWRPSTPPDYFYAPIDGLYISGVEGGALIDSSVSFVGPVNPSWGICLNASNIDNFKKTNFNCNNL